MADYAFLTRWRVHAPIDRVFETIGDAERWPEWWRGVESVELVRPGGEDGIGTVHRYAFRSRLPYALRFEVVVTEVVQPTVLAGTASGELAGTGRWTLEAVNDHQTDVTYDWRVRTTARWMNLLAPLTRGLFERNHDIIMDWGRQGLARRLGVTVERRDA